MLSRQLSVDKKTPFSFIWPHNTVGAAEGQSAMQLMSTFSVAPEEIGLSENTLGFRIGEKILVEYRSERCDEENPLRESVGVIAARRASGGQVWVVIAGNTGPATEGIVLALQRHPDLASVAVGPNPDDGFWAVIKVKVVEMSSIRIGDDRVITEVDIVHGPEPFLPP